MEEKSSKKLYYVFAGFVGVILVLSLIFGILIYDLNKKINENYSSILEKNKVLESEIGELKNDIELINKRFENEETTVDDSRKVYITDTGKRYHLNENCVISPIESTLNKALELGLTPCKKCAE